MKLIPRQLFAGRDAKSDIVVIMLLRIRQTASTYIHTVYTSHGGGGRENITRMCVASKEQQQGSLSLYLLGWCKKVASSALIQPEQEFRNDVLTRYLPVWGEILFARAPATKSRSSDSSVCVHLLLASACLRSARLKCDAVFYQQ
jgi:hypothetical protein